MKKLSFIFDKKVRLVALLLSFTLIFDVFFYDYKSANATGTGVAVAAAASTAIPVVGPFIAVTLVACGVVGAVEWCRNHPEEVESIRKDLVKALNDAGESYAEGVKTNNDANNASQVAGKEWIKSNIVDGKNYISDKILDTCLDVYSSHKLLDGQIITNNYEFKAGEQIGSNYSTDISLFTDSLPIKTSVKNEFIDYCNSLATNYDMVVLPSFDSDRMPDFFSVEGFDARSLSSCTVDSIVTYPSTHRTHIHVKDYTGYYFRCNFFNSYFTKVVDVKKVRHLDISLSINSIPSVNFDGKPFTFDISSLLGQIEKVGIETSDRVARKNPTTGNWELPWDTGANVNVEGVGDSYPVSIPWENSFVWNPSKVDYPDIALPFPGELDIPYPDLPITGSQEEVQTGEIELPEPIPNEPEIEENEESYMLPKWIEDRFPFCIPKDLSLLGSLFSSTSRQPPEWVAKLSYGDNKEYSIPINFKFKSADGSASFDRIAYICRLIQFILFLAGLMMVTRNLLRS